jgi:hypothetical protein
MTSSADELSRGGGAGSQWQAELCERGAVAVGPRSVSFWDPGTERELLSSAPTVHPLTDWAVLRASGADAKAFLQSQLASDVELVERDRCQLSTYCTAEGRVLANLFLWSDSSGYLLHLPADIADGIRSRLLKYVLRTRVQLTDASDAVRAIGLGGPGSATALRQLVGAAPAGVMSLVRSRVATAMRLGDDLFLAAVPRERWGGTWDDLAALARPAATQGWAWRLIRAGIPVITSATQGRFVPQMLNLEQLGAISFTKGCYPGQEIVARAQYRGEVKRRLFCLHAPAGVPEPGEEVFRPGETVPCGVVVNAAPAPSRGYDLLAVLLAEAAGAAALHLGTPEGPSLTPWR